MRAHLGITSLSYVISFSNTSSQWNIMKNGVQLNWYALYRSSPWYSHSFSKQKSWHHLRSKLGLIQCLLFVSLNFCQFLIFGFLFNGLFPVKISKRTNIAFFFNKRRTSTHSQNTVRVSNWTVILISLFYYHWYYISYQNIVIFNQLHIFQNFYAVDGV